MVLGLLVLPLLRLWGPVDWLCGGRFVTIVVGVYLLMGACNQALRRCAPLVSKLVALSRVCSCVHVLVAVVGAGWALCRIPTCQLKNGNRRACGQK